MADDLCSLDLLNACIPVFETLKDEHRQRILVQLVENGPLCVGDIAETSTLSRPAVSHHLKLLQHSGLVSVTKSGTQRYYRAEVTDGLRLLRRLLESLEADLAAGAGEAPHSD